MGELAQAASEVMHKQLELPQEVELTSHRLVEEALHAASVDTTVDFLEKPEKIAIAYRRKVKRALEVVERRDKVYTRAYTYCAACEVLDLGLGRCRAPFDFFPPDEAASWNPTEQQIQDIAVGHAGIGLGCNDDAFNRLSPADIRAVFENAIRKRSPIGTSMMLARLVVLCGAFGQKPIAASDPDFDAEATELARNIDRTMRNLGRPG